jgi:hypothetical protein
MGVVGLEIAKPDGMLVMFRATKGAKQVLTVHGGPDALVRKEASAAEREAETVTAKVTLRESGDEAVDHVLVRLAVVARPLSERNTASRADWTSRRVAEALNGKYTIVQVTTSKSGTGEARGWSEGAHWEAETPEYP